MSRWILGFVCSLWAYAQTAPIAFVGARLVPVEGAEIADGTLVVEGGRIVAIGPTSAVTAPRGARRVDAKGKVIMPGLVDSHSHIGGPEGADASAALQPDVRILDALDVRDTRIQKAQAGGITTVNVMPGSGHVLSGQTLYLKLRDGRVIDDLLIKLPDGRIAGGLKMANGTNPRRGGVFPGTRGKTMAMARDLYIKGQEYREKIRAANGDQSKMPARDLRLEAIVEVLDGKRTVHHHTHRHDDILSVLRLQKEFGFKLVLQHVTDGWMVADEIAKSGLPASVIVLDSPGGKEEARNMSFTNAGVLDKAGVLVGFHTDDGVTDSRLFLRSAALGVRGGMSREKALYAMTLANAKMLELDSRVGSLKAGKDADFIVLSGDPLSVYTKVLETWVDGVKVFDRTVEKDRRYAEGGEGSAERQSELHMHESEEVDQ
ncbi:MAG: amidohydrolase family protein [Bryobacterales bacterium]|nr:amidohydrolase family protein [Bryobacterales bacterium]